MSHVGRGTWWEKKVRDQYRELGYHVTRSAGSKGLFDLIAINKQLKLIILIECKHPDRMKKLSKNKKKEILEPLKTFEGQYVVTAELK